MSDVRRLDAVVAEAAAGPRFRTMLLGLMAALAIALAGAGIYGVLSYAVSQRTAEIGVRMALGAQPSSVRRMVMRQGLALSAAGIFLGLGGAYLLARVLGPLLYGISPLDALSFVAGPAFLLVVTLAASYVPARRATQIDPLVALRHQ